MDSVLKTLKDLGITYTLHEHPAVYTVAEAEQYYRDLKGGKSKNLLLRNKKGDAFYLVVLEASKQLNFNKLAEILNEKRLGFASPENLKDLLVLTPGSVSPFGLINDKEKKVRVVIDQDLWKYDRLHYHPNVNTATVELARDDFKKFLDWCGNQVIFAQI